MRARSSAVSHQFLTGALCTALCATCFGACGDPQVKTDDPWYPGELSCSTFDRLFKTEAEAYTRVTGKTVSTDEDKALAAWLWRNTHYFHGTAGQRDCDAWQRFGGDPSRDYWTGLFADGMALCGTTHAQWCAEMDALLGHGRSRVVGVNGHNSFEVYLTGGAYGQGHWALLDHDISTVIFARDGSRLLSLAEIVPDVKRLADPKFMPAREHGWDVSGLDDSDARGVYTHVATAEYLAGYAGAPPMVHLRSGESLRRYLEPGLDNGKTFVFWGYNYNTDGIPGPTRDRTWVNQPDKMFGSKHGTGAKNGQVRYANAVYDYTPNFADGAYRQGVIDEDAKHPGRRAAGATGMTRASRSHVIGRGSVLARGGTVARRSRPQRSGRTRGTYLTRAFPLTSAASAQRIPSSPSPSSTREQRYHRDRAAGTPA